MPQHNTTYFKYCEVDFFDKTFQTFIILGKNIYKKFHCYSKVDKWLIIEYLDNISLHFFHLFMADLVSVSVFASHGVFNP